MHHEQDDLSLRLLGTRAGGPNYVVVRPDGSPAFSGRSLRSEAMAWVPAAGAVVDFGSYAFGRPYPAPFGVNMLDLHGIDPMAVNHILFTHSHRDHFQPGSIGSLALARAREGLGPLHLYGHAACLAKLPIRDYYNDVETGPGVRSDCGPMPEGALDACELHPLEHGDSVTLGGVEFTAVRVNHWTVERGQAYPHRATDFGGEHSFGYLIRAGGCSVFYCPDTSLLLEPTYEFLSSFALDALIIDGTFYDHCDLDVENSGHLSAILLGPGRLSPKAARHFPKPLVSELRDRGIIATGTPVYVTHIHLDDYEAACAIARRFGHTISYDGMTVPLLA